MTFRANFLIDSITSMAWMFLNLAFYLLVFRYTGSIGKNTGWEQYQFFVFFATSMLINAAGAGVLHDERRRIDRHDPHRRAGLHPLEADRHAVPGLAPPRRVVVAFEPVVGLVLLVYALLRLAYLPGPIQVVLYLVYVACGVAIYYSLMIALASATVWMGRNLTLYDFWFYITLFRVTPWRFTRGRWAGRCGCSLPSSFPCWSW